MIETDDILGYVPSTCQKHGKLEGMLISCPNCEGLGYIYIDDWEGLDQEEEDCEECDGRGTHWICPECVKEPHTMTPPRVRVAGGDVRLTDPTRAAAYSALVPGISKIAREFGYCCAVHGSMTTDLDLLLCPWVDDAHPAADVVEAIRLYVGGRYRKYDVNPYEKPLGRLSWAIYLTTEGVESYGVVGPYIDISVTPRAKHPKKAKP